MHQFISLNGQLLAVSNVPLSWIGGNCETVCVDVHYVCSNVADCSWFCILQFHCAEIGNCNRVTCNQRVSILSLYARGVRGRFFFSLCIFCETILDSKGTKWAEVAWKKLNSVFKQIAVKFREEFVRNCRNYKEYNLEEKWHSKKLFHYRLHF